MFLQEQNASLQQQLFDLQHRFVDLAKTKHISNNNNNNNNITIHQRIQCLDPMNFEEFKKIAEEHFTPQYLNNGAYGFAKYALDHPFRNRILCTDYARKKILFKDSENKVHTDIQMNQLTHELFHSIKDMVEDFIKPKNDELHSEYDNLPDNQLQERLKNIGKVEKNIITKKIVMALAQGHLRTIPTVERVRKEFVKQVCSLSVPVQHEENEEEEEEKDDLSNVVDFKNNAASISNKK